MPSATSTAPAAADTVRRGLAEQHHAEQRREQDLGGLHRLDRAKRGRIVLHHRGRVEEKNRRDRAGEKRDAGRQSNLLQRRRAGNFAAYSATTHQNG